ncbi:NRDE family protein [Ureibacillus endophyticus]|uniref:NRDE family protein n=1 Tax=Ureibacillus endophyticus TaxID=1978490 RepID=A0A494YZ68_9BACL|nr:NRDE family protein [Lysinibacillus endophyticus]RKQ15489.1 NRDE family protein [Lysinibacillus endophyticus]
MCLINVHYNLHPKYPFILVANRDEAYSRPTKAAHFWDDQPSILAGRDLLQMGTWLGIAKNGRFAAVTNFRDPKEGAKPKSRGEIVTNFLTGSEDIGAFIENLRANRSLYGGYNVLLWDGGEFVHYNNRLDEVNTIQPGTHSLSNCSLNTPWSKVEKAKSKLEEHASQNNDINVEDLFAIVADSEIAEDHLLPDTGVGLELERRLSAMFIKMPNYGTRNSTVVLVDNENKVTFVERTFRDGEFQFDTRFEFVIEGE